MLSVWIGTKWSFAPTIALYRSRPIAASFGESWSLTKGKFWQTLVFNAAATLAYVAVWLGPVALASFAIGAVYHTDAAKIAQFASHYVPAIFIPVLVYGGIAEWTASAGSNGLSRREPRLRGMRCERDENRVPRRSL